MRRVGVVAWLAKGLITPADHDRLFGSQKNRETNDVEDPSSVVWAEIDPSGWAYNAVMDMPSAVRSWACNRDDGDPAAPFCATLTVGENVIAAGRGANEVSAYAALVAALDRQGIQDSGVLAMQALMRR